MTGERRLEILIAGSHAGTLIMSEGGMLLFSYDPVYAGPDLSVCLPVSGEEYAGRKVSAWFDNLLPDDRLVRVGMAAQMEVSAGVFPLLSHFGLDAPGAVQVVLPEKMSDAIGRGGNYRRLTHEQISNRLKRLVEAENSRRAYTWMLGEERWSLGGMQSKIALREFDGEWFECDGSAASNVIVKPGVGGLAAQALDECVTMRLAKMCHLPVADVRIESFAGFDAIVVNRYDRFTDSATGDVTRIHQEDLCQATGTVPQKKYAADGGPSSADVVKLLKGASDDSVGRFVDALLFNYLTASTDAHAKNYSLLHLERGKFRLAPLYDVASIAPYMEKGKVYRQAMSIGGENRVGWLRRTSLARFAKMHGLDADALADRTDELAERVRSNVERAADDFGSCAGIDELASRLVPRVRALCNAAERNIRADGKHFKPLDVSRVSVGG